MLSGKKFRLKTRTLGVESMPDGRRAVHLPEGEILTVLSGPKPDDRRMVDVEWDGRKIVLFAEDVLSRGEEIGDSSSAGTG